MKIHAKQVPPEHQEPPLFWDLEAGPLDGLELYGNRQLNRHTSALFDALPGILDDLAEEWENMQNGWTDCRNFSTWAEALAELAAPVGRPTYTREERRDEWPRIMAFYTESTSITPGLLRDVLGLITGKEWGFCTLRGCCQSDWQECIYRCDRWSPAALEELETEYFNTGTEWHVMSPDDPAGTHVYCHAWSDDGQRAEIAEAVGCDPGDVILQHFSGWVRQATWEEV